jgi:hypothetical protein
MSFLCWLATATQYDRSNTSRVVNMATTVLMIAALLLAIYLAIRDLNFLPSTSTKIAVLALAAIYPDLYILLHWISTSSAGVGFLSGSPVTPLSATPYSAGFSAMDKLGAAAPLSSASQYSAGSSEMTSSSSLGDL